MAAYIKPGVLPELPSEQDWGDVPDYYGMYRNDSVGDCTCAGAANLVGGWTGHSKTLIKLSDNDVITAYSAISGYNPTTGENDNGAVVLDVLKYWRKTGVGGHTISAFVALEPRNLVHLKASVYLFGGAYLGIALPVTAQDQTVWSVVDAPSDGEPGSWGGHAVVAVGYDALGVLVVTWGQIKRMTWDFYKKYADEAYGILSYDWVNATFTAPNKFAYADLQRDLACL